MHDKQERSLNSSLGTSEVTILNLHELFTRYKSYDQIDYSHSADETDNGYWKLLEYWNERLSPGPRELPSLTRQSSQQTRRNTLGLTRRTELNQPQLTWMLEMVQSETHALRIWTVNIGMPWGIGEVGPWQIMMSSFEHDEPIRFMPPPSPLHQWKMFACHYNQLNVGERQTGRQRQREMHFTII